MFTQAFTPEQEAMVWPIRRSRRARRSQTSQRVLNDPTLPVFRWLLNSMFVALSVTALVLSAVELTAYAFARLEFPGRDMIFFVLLTSLMVPGAVTLIPVSCCCAT